MADSSAGGLDAVPRRQLDAGAYERRSREGPCFVCETLAGNPDCPHHLVWAEEHAIAFLAKDPPLLGTTLVAPRVHREQVTGDFTMAEYLALQRLVYLVGKAVRQEVPTERLYLLSMGSQAGNRHVHWHIAPLPPGVPYRQQQLAALSWDRGVVALPDEEPADLARRIGAESSSCTGRSEGRAAVPSPCHSQHDATGSPRSTTDTHGPLTCGRLTTGVRQHEW